MIWRWFLILLCILAVAMPAVAGVRCGPNGCTTDSAVNATIINVQTPAIDTAISTAGRSAALTAGKVAVAPLRVVGILTRCEPKERKSREVAKVRLACQTKLRR